VSCGFSQIWALGAWLLAVWTSCGRDSRMQPARSTRKSPHSRKLWDHPCNHDNRFYLGGGRKWRHLNVENGRGEKSQNWKSKLKVNSGHEIIVSEWDHFLQVKPYFSFHNFSRSSFEIVKSGSPRFPLNRRESCSFASFPHLSLTSSDIPEMVVTWLYSGISPCVSGHVTWDICLVF